MKKKVKWSPSERLLVSPHWLNKEYDYYIYCQFAENFYEIFETTPYTTIELYLVKILPGYGRKKEKFAVVEEWRQEGDPSYSDCYEHTLKEFDDIDSAIKFYERRVDELDKEYPQR